MAPQPLDDRALEALLSGTSAAQSGFDWLVPFVDELDEASQETAPVVRPALALLLAEGFTAVPNDVPAPAPRPSTNRRKLGAGELLGGGVAARLAGMGLWAKAALGATLVAASATAAGAVGALPGPAQHAVATVVGAATPFTFPDSANAKAGFGATVSSDATGASDGVHGVDGTAVSGAARDKHGDEGTAGADGTPVGPNTGATGLDRANETPAAGHVPTSAPVATGKPTTPGSEGSKGLDTASTTPAGDKIPTTVPAGGKGTSGGNPAVTTPTTARAPSHP